MKNIFILLSFALFYVTSMQVQAQETDKKAVKNEIKEAKKEVKKEKQVLKAEKKELRKLEKGDVSYQSKQEFYSDFGDVKDAQWKRSDYFDEVTFTKDGQSMKAYYDSQSKLVGTTSHKKFEDLPISAQKEIKSKYKNYTIKSVMLFDDNEANDSDMLLYGAQFEDSDNYFVELIKGDSGIVLQVTPEGNVFYFTKL